MERRIKTKIDGVPYEFDVYDTDPMQLSELLKRDILRAYKWDNYYVFKIKTDDYYDAQVFIVDSSTKKVEWGYYTTLGIVVEENGREITPEELRRALS